VKKAFFNWSGGKDSSLALYYLLQSEEYAVAYLITTVNAAYDRISMHGVRRELLELQAESIGIPVRTILLPDSPSMSDYEAAMQEGLQPLIGQGIRHSIFGDIFLEDLRAYRE
jgi:diphthamide synthase (EF-2-diphthine--ammonia ligase)